MWWPNEACRDVPFQLHTYTVTDLLQCSLCDVRALKGALMSVQRHEREMKQKLEEQEETALNIAETYNSLQQEVEIKTKKLKKVNRPFYSPFHTGKYQLC